MIILDTTSTPLALCADIPLDGRTTLELLAMDVEKDPLKLKDICGNNSIKWKYAVMSDGLVLGKVRIKTSTYISY